MSWTIDVSLVIGAGAMRLPWRNLLWFITYSEIVFSFQLSALSSQF
jgi:hypothetical protein